MLLAVSDKARAYIRIALEVADKPGVIFTSGNAASNDTSFESGPFKVHIVHWDVVLSKRWTGRNYPDGKRQRCAEVLVPDLVETKYILDIRCLNLQDVRLPQALSHLLREDPASLAP
jgi:hypothetical protein